MNKFKENWEINNNWQLIFPFLGWIALGYSSYKLAYVFLKNFNVVFIVLLSAILFFVLLKLTLLIFEKLEKKWQVNYRWELINIFLVFAITGFC